MNPTAYNAADLSKKKKNPQVQPEDTHLQISYLQVPGHVESGNYFPLFISMIQRATYITKRQLFSPLIENFGSLVTQLTEI